jgi:SAM-dependent methyltransferase
MTTSASPDWLNEQHPHEAQQAAAQLAALQDCLAGRSMRVLDLGCGAGRLLVPLAQAGHEVTGIDNNSNVLARCGEALAEASASATLIESDFLADDWPDATYDAVLLLGNTLMTIVDMHDAVQLLQRAGQSLADGGMVILDDLPGDFWPELTEGNWQGGVSEDGDAQLVWDARDSVFALRFGDAVDTDQWDFKSDDQRLRLWTSSLLSLTCQIAGLSEPVVHPGLLVMQRAK